LTVLLPNARKCVALALMRRRTVVTTGVGAVALLCIGCGSSGRAVQAGSPAPAPSAPTATIEVRSQSGTIAAIAGAAERSILVADGVAVFDGLADGTYRVVVTNESTPVPAKDGVDIGAAQQIQNGGTYDLRAGDHAVVTCDESGCSGVLPR
jgi:hypothetical protein